MDDRAVPSSLVGKGSHIAYGLMDDRAVPSGLVGKGSHIA